MVRRSIDPANGLTGSFNMFRFMSSVCAITLSSVLVDPGGCEGGRVPVGGDPADAGGDGVRASTACEGLGIPALACAVLPSVPFFPGVAGHPSRPTHSPAETHPG